MSRRQQHQDPDPELEQETTQAPDPEQPEQPGPDADPEQPDPAAESQTTDYTRCGGHVLTDFGWVPEDPAAAAFETPPADRGDDGDGDGA